MKEVTSTNDITHPWGISLSDAPFVLIGMLVLHAALVLINTFVEFERTTFRIGLAG